MMEVNDSTHVVALSGSRRDGSHTRTALETALAAARDRGATTTLVDLDAFEVPVFDPGNPDAGDAPALREEVRRADAVLLGTPMYHGSFASPLKTALDYCGFDEFEDTTVGLLAVAGGGFPTPALEHLRMVARELDAWVLPQQVAIPNAGGQIEDGGIADADLRERVESLGTALVEYAGVADYSAQPAGCVAPTAD